MARELMMAKWDDKGRRAMIMMANTLACLTHDIIFRQILRFNASS
jgi:hypothetical protein